MVKKSILLLSSAFYPEISPRSFRATELAKELCRQGHNVSVISKNREYDYTEFLTKYPIQLRMWSKPKFPGIPVFNSRTLAKVARVLMRLLSVFFEYPGIEVMFLVKKALKDQKDYDLMISFAVPFTVHWGVASVRTNLNQIAKIWVADCGDPYMFSRLDTFRKPFYFSILEKKFCKQADYISVPFPAMKSQFYPEFEEKIRVIPQGFNFKEVVLCENKPVYDKTVFLFAGSLIPGKRDLSLFLDFLCSSSFDFCFIVYTNKTEWFNKYKNILREKLVINTYIDRIKLIYEMSKVDFLVNIDTIFDNDKNTEAFPSKLIDYAISNRPILSLNSSILDEDLVVEFINKNYTRRRIIDISSFDITTVSSKFLEIGL